MHEDEPAAAISAAQVAARLQRAKLIRASRGIRLEPVSRNPERRDLAARASFRVRQYQRPLGFLTVGRHLDALWQSTRAFAQAIPDLACRPLLRWRTHGWDCVLVEPAAGETLEELAASGRMTGAEVVAAGERVVAALAQTERASTAAAAQQELETWLARMADSAMFSGFDQRFLRDALFPLLRSGVQIGPWRTRWTNGDLVPRNVFRDARGTLRVVDCELAARTHFFGDDWWRWQTYSTLPAEARDLPSLRAVATPPAMEAFFLLRQAVLAHELNGVAVALADSRGAIHRLVELAAAAHHGFRSSVFLRALREPPTPAATSVPPSAAAAAQLYWSVDDAPFAEASSQAISLPDDVATPLSFRLPPLSGRLRVRLDPVNHVGVVHLFRLTVRRAEAGETLWTATAAEAWNQLEVASGALRLPEAGGYTIVSLNDDPILLLPELDLGPTPVEVTVDCDVTYSRRLDALPALVGAECEARLQPVLTELAETQAIAGRLAGLHEANQRRLMRLETRLHTAGLDGPATRRGGHATGSKGRAKRLAQPQPRRRRS